MKYVDVNGTRVPALGFGTFELEPQDARRMVRHALEAGYRHIDTAQAYRNETEVGQGIQESGVSREDVFLTTKVWTDRFRSGDLERSADESLERLGTDYVDLLLLHWPNPDVPLDETLKALMKVKDTGRARHIGISNFTTRLVREAVDIVGEGQLLTNQVEYHVFLSQRRLMEQARELGISITAYCPLARGEVLGNDVLETIGASYGKSEPQVALRWLLQQDVIAIPRSTKEKNADANLDVFDFELSPDDMRRIDEQLQGDGRKIDPSFAPEWDAA